MNDLAGVFSQDGADEVLSRSTPAGEVYLYAFAAILDTNVHFKDLDDNGNILSSFVYENDHINTETPCPSYGVVLYDQAGQPCCRNHRLIAP